MFRWIKRKWYNFKERRKEEFEYLTVFRFKEFIEHVGIICGPMIGILNHVFIVLS